MKAESGNGTVVVQTPKYQATLTLKRMTRKGKDPNIDDLGILSPDFEDQPRDKDVTTRSSASSYIRRSYNSIQSKRADNSSKKIYVEDYLQKDYR